MLSGRCQCPYDANRDIERWRCPVTVLGAFGLSEDSERLYRSVLRTDRQRADQHAAALGWDLERAKRAQGALLALRLLRTEPGGVLTAEHPRASISRLVDRESARLDLRRRELDDVRAAVSEFAADHRAGRGSELVPTALEVLSPGDEVTAVEELLRTTTGTLRATHADVASGPVTHPGVLALTHLQMSQGRELRSIYPVDVLQDAGHLQWIGDWGAVGEQQRLVEQIEHEFVVFGDEAVIAPPHWGATDGGTVVLRLPLVVRAFTRLFDTAWEAGLPVPGPHDDRDVSARLLTLLAAGFKDEAIARYLGIGVRTVRRRVAETMDELGVHTRFQLGVAAERRSLLGRPRR